MNHLALFCSIAVVALSGALKLHFAYNFLGAVVPFNEFITAALITYAAYAFDRGIENKEDETRGEMLKKILIYTAILSILISLILYPNPALLLPFFIAYLYTKGIAGHRLKGGRGVKNAIVAFTFALGTAIFIGILSLPALLVYLFFFGKSFVNTILYDVRDVESDNAAGLRTIPAILSTRKLCVFLLAISFTTHALLLGASYAGLLAGADVMMVSTLHTAFYILRYVSGYEKFRNAIVDGEWMIYGGYAILRDLFS